MAVLKEAGPIALQQFWDLCKWTNKEQEIKEQYSVLLGGSPTAVLEAMLFLTALIEHSLGKIFLLHGETVPSLLRDLLGTQELKNILGSTPIVFMQVLIGTPLGMNLRNIVWHGFPRPEEIKDHFVTTLLITVASIGELLETQGVDICQLPNRTPVVNLPECAEVLAGCFPNIHDYQEQVLELNQPHSTTWDAILQHYIERRYGTSLALVLPHLEQLLRVIFCTVNNCQVRLLTAETTAFYTTLDEILAPTIVGAGGTVVNNMRSLLGDSIIELLEDMLTHQAGPRVRDKLSHGECDLLNIPPALTNHVICVALALMCRLANTLVVLSSTAEDGEIEVRISRLSLFILGHTCSGDYDLHFHDRCFVVVSEEGHHLTGIVAYYALT
uniref:DUF4209 domain-containing protein n=1 Tax=Timema cristinae TaxID=61476 RepID=A0A7R9H0E7_TIMCR|nr:unnamed protein product [Timema cristinae]